MLEKEIIGILNSMCSGGAIYIKPDTRFQGEPLAPEKFANPFYPVQQHASSCEMVYLIDGEAAFHINGDWFKMPHGRLIVLYPNVKHSEHCWDANRPYRIFWITPSPTAITFYVTCYSPERGYGLQWGRRRIKGTFCDEVWRKASFPEDSPVKLHCAIMRALDQVCTMPASSGTQVSAKFVASEVKCYFDRHFDRQISVSEVASLLHLSVTHTERMFKNQYKMTPHRYLTHVRMERAAKLLADPRGHAVGQIARRCGIEDQRYFSRLFKSYFRMTPSRYREQHTP